MMTEIDKEQMAKLKTQAKEITDGMMQVFMENRWDKRACVMATMKIAAGMARGANMDMHRAIHLFMTFYKDADEHFNRAGHK
jgi:tRNA nucleotidyltransferase (CCA-adding enzyme)